VKLGILETGASLVETLVPLGLATVAAKLVEAIATNSISERIRRKRLVVVKRRNIHSEQLAELTTLYFRVSGIPIRFWSKVQDWQRWEVDCFQCSTAIVFTRALPALERLSKINFRVKGYGSI